MTSNKINSRKMKIVLINSDGEYKKMESNKGAEAVIVSSLKILRHFFPDAEYVSTIQLSEDLCKSLNCNMIHNKTYSHKTYSPYTSLNSTSNLLRCIVWKMLKDYFHYDFKVLINNKKLREYHNADLIIHLGMDLYSDDFGTRTVLEHSKDLFQAILLGNKVVIWAESVGPFKSKITQKLANITLNRVSLITLREEISKSYLEEISVNKPPISITMDPAFLLDPIEKAQIKYILEENGITEISKPLIGMSLSLSYMAGGMKKSRSVALINKTSKIFQYLMPEELFDILLKHGRKSETYSSARLEYTKLMAGVLDHLIEELNVDVFLIPHLQHSLVGEKIIHEMVLQQAKHKERIKLISSNCTAREVKGIIGQCDLFIGGRMHACIAALSQNIPTVALSYSYKFQGIAGMVGLEKYVCTDITYDNVIEKVMSAWKFREEISSELKYKYPRIVEKALENGELVQKLLTK